MLNHLVLDHITLHAHSQVMSNSVSSNSTVYCFVLPTDLPIQPANANNFKSERDHLSPLFSTEGKYLKDNSRNVKSITSESIIKKKKKKKRTVDVCFYSLLRKKQLNAKLSDYYWGFLKSKD